MTKRYESNGSIEGHTALSDVDLHISPGQFVCLLGPSGCGKSTLLNLIAGILFPTAGQVLFDNRPVIEPAPERGVVFQDSALFPWLTVQGNVEFGMFVRGMPKSQRRIAATEVLRLVGLDDYAQAYPHTLSGGMRQRVALARVLVLDPPVLLMDEPFGALDANSRERLQDELLRLWQLHRRTILFVTHNVEEAAYLAERVIVMGPAPISIRKEGTIDLPHPRIRNSAELVKVTAQLRQALAEMPCCQTSL